jgi:hypothetical protein
MWLMIASVLTNGAGGIFLSPEKQTSTQLRTGVVVGSTASPRKRTCARYRFKEFKSDRRRTWLSVKT